MPQDRNRTTTPPDQYATPTDSPTATPILSTMPTTDTDLTTRLQILTAQVPQAYVTPLCGAGAGMASGIVTCPLDVIKTKLQAQGGFAMRKNGKIVPSTTVYKGMVGTARMIWHEEGLRGMYRGLGPMLLGYLPTWAVYLTVYDKSRQYFYDKSGKNDLSDHG